MNCLLCLRTEDYLYEFEAKELEIFLRLFKLPKELVQSLKDLQHCWSCQLKLQVLVMINKQIDDIKEKLKDHESEVKEMFMNSFNAYLYRIDDSTLEARSKLQTVLEITSGTEKFQLDRLDVESIQNELEVPIEEIEIQMAAVHNVQIENCEIPKADPLEEMDSNANKETEEINSDEPIELNDPEVCSPSLNSPVEPMRPRIIITRLKIEKSPEPRQSISTSYSQESKINSGQPECSHNGASVQRKLNSSQLKSKNTRVNKGTNQKVRLSPSSNKPELQISHKLKKSKQIRKTSKQTLKGRVSLCGLCNPKMQFERLADYEEHLKTAHSSRPYSKCPTCKRIIVERVDGKTNVLRRHIRVVHGKLRPFKCVNCKASFKTKNCLNQHNEVHKEIREVFICKHCNVSRIGKRNFSAHLKKKHLV